MRRYLEKAWLHKPANPFFGSLVFDRYEYQPIMTIFIINRQTNPVGETASYNIPGPRVASIRRHSSPAMPVPIGRHRPISLRRDPKLPLGDRRRLDGDHTTTRQTIAGHQNQIQKQFGLIAFPNLLSNVVPFEPQSFPTSHLRTKEIGNQTSQLGRGHGRSTATKGQPQELQAVYRRRRAPGQQGQGICGKARSVALIGEEFDPGSDGTDGACQIVTETRTAFSQRRGVIAAHSIPPKTFALPGSPMTLSPRPRNLDSITITPLLPRHSPQLGTGRNKNATDVLPCRQDMRALGRRNQLLLRTLAAP